MSHHDSPSPASIDVAGIGNALVDVLASAPESLIVELDLAKGSMGLVDADRSAEIYGHMGPGTEISGGSVANSMVGVASFGGRSHYLGKVREDQLGDVFVHDIRANGVGFTTSLATDGPPTGSCLILVTPDAQRTMNTHLGASVHFGPDDVDPAVVTDAEVLFLEGYLFDPPAAQEAFKVAAKLARDAGRRVAITLSDPFCVERHRAAFVDLVDNHVDVVVANSDELLALYEVDDIDQAHKIVADRCPMAVVTHGADGSFVITSDQQVEVAAEPVANVVDTTGAGDQYAAGFFYGLATGLDLETCGRLGSVAAAEVISHMGARPLVSLAELAAPILNS